MGIKSTLGRGSISAVAFDLEDEFVEKFRERLVACATEIAGDNTIQAHDISYAEFILCGAFWDGLTFIENEDERLASLTPYELQLADHWASLCDDLAPRPAHGEFTRRRLFTPTPGPEPTAPTAPVHDIPSSAEDCDDASRTN